MTNSRILISIFFGLLTFVITPVIALMIAFGFLVLGKGPEQGPVFLIAKLFGLRDLGGFFAAQGIFAGLLWLLGDAVTAFISWLINRSRALAAVTFISAFLFQAVTLSFLIPNMMKASQTTMDEGIRLERSFTQYASIGDVRFEGQEPFKQMRAINGELLEFSLFKRLLLKVPILVKKAGTYKIYAQYNDIDKSAITTFSEGLQTVNVEFSFEESRGFGYLPPEKAKTLLRIRMFYLADLKQLLESVKPHNALGMNVFRQFTKDNPIKGDESVEKFVTEKETQF